uniref:Glycosyl transferase family 25 domain-containing protein n=1 Tax=viral metagenome TaxID=1070528 RepID=A0A6C0K3C0_9ZZZZ
MNQIDAILYINLASRPDRRDHFLSEIQHLTADLSKVHRINAVHHTKGALGCTQSHIKALETFLANPSWKTCLIFEDDFTFRNQDVSANQQALATLFREFPALDCACLAYNPIRVTYKETQIESIKKAISTQTASGYCITRTFAPVLLENLRESFIALSKFGDPDTNMNDQYWKRLQPQNNWYLFVPALGYQYANFSDIEKKLVHYNC